MANDQKQPANAARPALTPQTPGANLPEAGAVSATEEAAAAEALIPRPGPMGIETPEIEFPDKPGPPAPLDPKLQAPKDEHERSELLVALPTLNPDPSGLPLASSIDPTTLVRPVLSSTGWILPLPRAGA